ncbi:hypothetical protein PT974_01627 [Cladobotryum mycophilum]|uniref:Zn(2)-C6 fungal-type domain-containing protein n=1 Tax=Cladobotryum mycophilum TaxID=491253 RepID=A0ABR0T473_9HYPO
MGDTDATDGKKSSGAYQPHGSMFVEVASPVFEKKNSLADLHKGGSHGVLENLLVRGRDYSRRERYKYKLDSDKQVVLSASLLAVETLWRPPVFWIIVLAFDMTVIISAPIYGMAEDRYQRWRRMFAEMLRRGEGVFQLTQKRHVKCDETRPACLNCMKWRGYCDAYTDNDVASETSKSSKVPRATASDNLKLIHTKKAPLILTEPAINIIRFENEEQRSYFDQWSVLSVGFLGGCINQTRLWTTTMPQLALEEETLRYGAMAIGALRKAYEVEGLGVELTTGNKHYLNAVVYYCEALRMQSKARPTREGLRTALLSSLLFICFEAQRGNMPAALKHITHGFTMLNELANCTDKAADLVSIAPAPPALVQDILDCYKPLELQSRTFMGSYKNSSSPQNHRNNQDSRHYKSLQRWEHRLPKPRVPLVNPEHHRRHPFLTPIVNQLVYRAPGAKVVPKLGLTTITSLDAMPNEFQAWDEMQDYWTLVQRQMVFHLPMLTRITSQLGLTKIKSMAELETKLSSVRKHPEIGKFIADSKYWMQRWIEAFQPLYTSIMDNAENDPHLHLQAMSTRIEYLILYIYTAIPRYSSIVIAKDLTPQYQEINTLAEKLLESRPNCGFAMDAGWTWPLFVVAFGCRDPAVKAEAMRILEKYPIRNALRDSRVFRAIALRNLETEELNAMEGDENEQWLRLRRREVVFEDLGASIIYRSAQKDLATGEWVLVEEVADYNVGQDGKLVWQRQPISESESILSGVC